MYDIVVIGAGPAGIGMAVEARAMGIPPDRLLLLEKASEHSFTLKKYYPDEKLVTANYKGFEAVCTGVMCMTDLSKHETISFLDRAIQDNHIHVRYDESVYRISKHEAEQRFTIFTDKAEYETRVVAISIGILGKPNKPAYKISPNLRERVLFDVTSRNVSGARVLVVGGGDSASEYCQYLVQKNNTVTLSYRQSKFTRMNEINLQSLLALAGAGKVEVLYNSHITTVEESAGSPQVHWDEPGLSPRIFDYVIYALGGTTPNNFLRMIGIEFDGEDPTLKEGYETNVAGMFLIGDLSAGRKGGSIIWAFNSANTAMKKICREYITRTS